MQEKYYPLDMNGCLAHAAEECAELIQALAKAQRFGVDNNHPKTKEHNLDAIMREYADVQEAMRRIFKKYQHGERNVRSGLFGEVKSRP